MRKVESLGRAFCLTLHWTRRDVIKKIAMLNSKSFTVCGTVGRFAKRLTERDRVGAGLRLLRVAKSHVHGYMEIERERFGGRATARVLTWYKEAVRLATLRDGIAAEATGPKVSFLNPSRADELKVGDYAWISHLLSNFPILIPWRDCCLE